MVVSYRFWQEQLASDPSAVGKTLRVNSQPATVIGVGPKEFLGASPVLFGADLWMPLSVGERVAPELAGQALERRDRTIFRVVGRLRPGVTNSRVEAELDATAQQIEQENGDAASTQKGRRVQLVEGGKMLPLRKQDLPFFTSFFTVMSGLIMLIACANVGNMMLARAAGRRKEIAVRLALGASRARIVRQLLTESMIVVAAAAVPGFLTSVWLMRLLSGVRMPYLIPVTYDLRPDASVLVLTIVLTGFTGLIFGLVPALQATRTDLAPALKEGGNVRLPGRHRLSLRNVLMVGQFAGSLTLLVILGLLSMGIQTTMGIQAGFNPKNLYLISLDPVRDGYSAAQTTAFLQKLLDRVKLLPSVTSASLTETVPVSIGGTRVRVSAPGDAAHETLTVIRHVVGKDYFDTTGIALPAGRAFRQDDVANQTAAVIVSQEFARQFWKGSDRVGPPDRDWRRCGHAVRNPARLLRLSRRRRGQPAQGLRSGGRGGRRGGGPHRAKAIAGDLLPAAARRLRQACRARHHPDGARGSGRRCHRCGAPGNVRDRPEDHALQHSQHGGPDRSIHGAASLEFLDLRIRRHFRTGALGGRTGRDDGILRGAARARDRHSHGVGSAAGQRAGAGDEGRPALVLAGTAFGMAGAWTGSRLLSAMNSSVGKVTSTSTTDPTVLFGAPLLLAFLALLACYVPARKSMRIDPVVALRQE